MGPKGKKQAKNAFSFFLDEYVDKLRAEGRHISLKVAAEECGPLWSELSNEGKEKYVKLAGNYKAVSGHDKYSKFTSLGVSYAEMERKQEEIQRKIEKADYEIRTTIGNLDSELIKTHLFHIVHCNYYCKTDEGMYIPGEIAISEFNLEEGIRNTFHCLIDPGAIPLGFAFEAQQTIDSVHGLPYPPYEEGESDYFGVLEKILDFLEPGRLPDGRYPPLYCTDNNIKASENILQFLSDNRGELRNYFRVYQLTKMFFSLKNKCVEDVEEENVGFPVLSTAENEISKDIFCYVSGISCTYHIQSEDKYQNCSLSVVQRLAYIICDHCCQHIGVKLIPGKHCRMNCDPDWKSNRAKREKTRKKQESPPRSEFGAQSSYGGDVSSYDWKREYRGSFLHEEIESSMQSLEVSSVASRSTYREAEAREGFPSGRWRRLARGEEEEECSEELEEDFKRILSLGRGASFR